MLEDDEVRAHRTDLPYRSPYPPRRRLRGSPRRWPVLVILVIASLIVAGFLYYEWVTPGPYRPCYFLASSPFGGSGKVPTSYTFLASGSKDPACPGTNGAPPSVTGNISFHGCAGSPCEGNATIELVVDEPNGTTVPGGFLWCTPSLSGPPGGCGENSVLRLNTQAPQNYTVANPCGCAEMQFLLVIQGTQGAFFSTNLTSDYVAYPAPP